MKFWESLVYIFKSVIESFKKEAPASQKPPHEAPAATPAEPKPAADSVPAPDPGPRAREDEVLAGDITLYQMTVTNRTRFQAENRVMTDKEIRKLRETAELVVTCEKFSGQNIEIHSGRRYPALNKDVGGSKKSQHMRCEAADFSPEGPDTEAAMRTLFQAIWDAAKRGELKFGQLILETSKKRGYARVWWIHISLAKYRSPKRCGEVLEMKDGKYKGVGKVPV